MKYLFKIFALGILALGTFSCDDFLKETPNGQLLTSDAFKQASDVDDAVDVLYRQVSRGVMYDTQNCEGQMGDDISTHPASNKALNRELDLYNVSSGNACTLDEWSKTWLIIKAANYILDGAANAPGVSEATLNYALNQAHFWRGWSYFKLVRLFGPIPKVVSNNIETNIGLTTVAKIYDEVIIPDLTAAENLPDNYTTAPQALNGINVVANSAAAKALLSNVYLTMAGWPLNRGTEYYTLAAKKAKEVIDGLKGRYHYAMYDDYAELFSVKLNTSVRNNKELILGTFYNYALYGDGDRSEAARGAIVDIPDCADGYNNIRGEISFWYNMPDGPRKTTTYPVVTYVKANNAAYPWYSSSVPEGNRFPYGGKYLETNDMVTEYDPYKSMSSQFRGWGQKTHQMIRISEVYLWYAEALGRSGQTNAEAVSYVNMVRNRADGKGASAIRSDGSANVYPSTMSASELAEAAYNEHGWEVAMEWTATATRYHDMQRMNRVQNHFNLRAQNPIFNINGNAVKEPNTPSGTWAEWKMFVPTPESDVLLNKDIGISLEDKMNLIK